jgi:biotin carboxyl carrier protein
LQNQEQQALHNDPNDQKDHIKALLQLARRARHAESSPELGFILVNETYTLAPFRQAALWFADAGVVALSGVVAPEANAPFVHWLDRVATTLGVAAASAADGDSTSAELQAQALSASQPIVIDPDQIAANDAAEWDEWLPAQALWMPISFTDDKTKAIKRGGLLLARDEPWTELDVGMLSEWLDSWTHAWQAKHQRSSLGLFARWLQRPRLPDQTQVSAPWHQRVIAGVVQLRRQHLTKQAISEFTHTLPARLRRAPAAIWHSPRRRYTALALLCMLIPVRLSILVPGELVPANPAAIRAPLEGTVDKFFIAPNARVKAGDVLLQLDATSLNSRLETAQEGLATAEAEYRQAAQQAVFDSRSKPQLALLQGRIAERATEVAFVKSQLTRTQVTAPSDGIALLDDPSEWIGKPVITGERVMIVADEKNVEVEAWLSPADMIDFAEQAPVTLYLNSAPLTPVQAQMRYLAHDAVIRPDGSYAYRLRATLQSDSAGENPRVGLKGTARVSGRYVPAIYWVLRRPLASIRPFLGW